MQEDLVAVRLNAHLQYILPRINNADKQVEFLQTMRILMDAESSLPSPLSKHGGAEMAYSIYNEILYLHIKRFEEGREQAPFYLERI